MSTNQSGAIYPWLYFTTVMSTAFYGFTCMQTFFYYVHYQNDSLQFKLLVAVVWAVNTIHEGLTVAGTYKYIAGGLANSLSLSNYPPELNLQALATTVVAVLTQGCLMYRIYIFSGRKMAALLLWFVLGVVEFVLSIMYVAKAVYSVNGDLSDVNITVLDDNTFKTLATLSFSFAAGLDLLIATTLVILLIRNRPAIPVARTTHMLQRLMVFAVNTGTWTATFALLSIIFMYALPSKTLYTLFIFPICSIYCNTILANLNVRSYLKDGTLAGSEMHDGSGSCSLPSQRWLHAV